MLIPFPLGLLSTSLVFDVVHLLKRDRLWSQLAFWNIAAGIVGGLAAAVFGLIDWLAIPSGTRAKRVGLLHGVGNVVVVGLFGASWLLRRGEPGKRSALPITLSALGVVLSAVTGWLGGELVDRLGVSIDEGAHLNAPSSLSGRAAAEGTAGAPRAS
jgi:uncharacterized membrane protein